MRSELDRTDCGWPLHRVAALEEARWLLVEDGNHGEYRPRSDEFATHGTAFIRAADMADGRVLFETAEHINSAALRRIRKGVGKTGDVLFSHKGTVGKLALVAHDAPPFVCSPQTTFWRTLDERQIDRRFLYCFMRSPAFRHQWEAVKGETDMADYVSLTAQRRFHIPVPPLSTQRAIARVLGALDDKIELNRHLCRTLEAMAQALFKSWFVDFAPVVAKAAGRQPYGMDAAGAALFPSRFVNSELGRIPEEWRVESVPTSFEVNPRRALPAGVTAAYLDMQNMPTDTALPQEWSTRAAGSGMRFVNGDTLIARITPCLENGKTCFVNFLGPGDVGWGSTEYIVLRSRPPLPELFSYLFARSDDFRGHAIANMTGSSGRQRVPPMCLEQLKLARPSEPVARAFGALVEPNFELMRRANEEARTLASLHDALLPKLLSGEIRVKDAEKAVEKAL